jgi:hypothetical protein
MRFDKVISFIHPSPLGIHWRRFSSLFLELGSTSWKYRAQVRQDYDDWWCIVSLPKPEFSDTMYLTSHFGNDLPFVKWFPTKDSACPIACHIQSNCHTKRRWRCRSVQYLEGYVNTKSYFIPIGVYWHRMVVLALSSSRIVHQLGNWIREATRFSRMARRMVH